MKRILESPKIIVYENVEKVNAVLELYCSTDLSDEIAVEILKALDMPLGTKTKVDLFENHLQAYFEKGRITLAVKQ